MVNIGILLLEKLVKEIMRGIRYNILYLDLQLENENGITVNYPLYSKNFMIIVYMECS